MHRRNVKTAASATLASLTIALSVGCGGGDGEGDAPSSNGTGDGAASDGELTLTAAPDGSLDFLDKELSAEPGQVTVRLRNESDVVHDVVITKDGEEVLATDRVTAGTAKASGKLEPGSYTFFCSVTGHRIAGMEGTLKVG